MNVKLKSIYLWTIFIENFELLLNKFGCWLFNKRCKLDNYRAKLWVKYSEFLYKDLLKKQGGNK